MQNFRKTPQISRESTSGIPWDRPFRQYGGTRSHQVVAAADPLGFATRLKEVPRLNHKADVQGLVELLRRIHAESGDGLADNDAWLPNDGRSFAATAAVVRDVGLLLGSIRRHGEEPLDLLPEIEPWLVWAGRRTDLPPRDTLLHYTVWNPDNALRTYTGLPEEVELIRAVKIAFPALEEGISHLVDLFEIPLGSPDFAATGDRAFQCISAVRGAAIHTFQHVDRKVFIRSIRPYFEPIRVAGQDYLGPGAVAMPLFVFDHILWSAPVIDPAYVKFKEDYLPVTLPYLRDLYRRFSDEGCLLERLVAVLGEEDASSPQIQAGLRALDRTFTLIQRFRSVHLRMAEQAYHHHQSEFVKGSGGYRPDMLGHIYRLAAKAQQLLRSHIHDRRLVPGAWGR